MQIKVSNDQNLYKIIELIKNSEELDIEVFFEKKAKLYENASNLKILQKVAKDHEKELKFAVEDKNHLDYINAVNEDRLEFNTPEIDIDYDSSVSAGSKLAFLSVLNPSRFFKRKNNYSTNDDASYMIGSSFPGKYKRFFKPVIIASLILFFIGGSAYAALTFIPMANVTVKVKSEVLIKLIDMKAIKDAKVSVEDKTIPSLAISVTETESKSIATTGTKLIGDKATGKVMIYNKTDEDEKLKKGTEVKAISTDDKNLKYIITKEVTIPKQVSETVDMVTTITPGEKEVDVEALEFGEKYNIDDGEKFEIGDVDTDDLVGENDEKIAGGKQEEIKVVAQVDLDNLKRELEESLKKTVAESIKRKKISTQELSESSIQFETLTATYNKKLDEEAEELKLDLSMSGNGLAYSKDDLDMVVKESAKSVVPETFNLDSENIDYETAATIDSTDKNVLNIQVKLRSHIMPKIDIEEIKRELTGSSLSDAERYLSGLNNIESYGIELSPRLPGALLRLPMRKDNINVKLDK
ncbi:MAG: hypothetical protein QG570_577 [Patescibacteria group bacterium]|nr:hypothetical protein [Patescibacteria group bacterium]